VASCNCCTFWLILVIFRVRYDCKNLWKYMGFHKKICYLSTDSLLVVNLCPSNFVFPSHALHPYFMLFTNIASNRISTRHIWNWEAEGFKSSVVFLRPLCELLLFNSWSSYTGTVFGLTTICISGPDIGLNVSSIHIFPKIYSFLCFFLPNPSLYIIIS